MSDRASAFSKFSATRAGRGQVMKSQHTINGLWKNCRAQQCQRCVRGNAGIPAASRHHAGKLSHPVKRGSVSFVIERNRRVHTAGYAEAEQVGVILNRQGLCEVSEEFRY